MSDVNSHSLRRSALPRRKRERQVPGRGVGRIGGSDQLLRDGAGARPVLSLRLTMRRPEAHTSCCLLSFCSTNSSRNSFLMAFSMETLSGGTGWSVRAIGHTGRKLDGSFRRRRHDKLCRGVVGKPVGRLPHYGDTMRRRTKPSVGFASPEAIISRIRLSSLASCALSHDSNALDREGCEFPQGDTNGDCGSLPSPQSALSQPILMI